MGLRDYLGLTEASTETAELREVNGQLESTLELMEERMAELELAIDDSEGPWNRLTGDGVNEFSRDGLDIIIRRSRLYYLANPLINRGVEVQRLYVFGQGVSFSAEDEAVNEVVQSFLRLNKREFAHQALGAKEVELAATGNLFFRLFPNISDGAVRVRMMPVEEIRAVITNPEDRSEPWYYLRTWTDAQQRPMEVLYPDWEYVPERGRAPVYHFDGKNYSVDWTTPICHVKVGGFAHMRFGIPETYSALDWARAYQQFLQDWFSIVKAYSRFAWRATTKGGVQGVTALKTKLGTGVTSGSPRESNPPPLVGAIAAMGEGKSLDPIRTAGATTKAEDGRRGLLMVAAAMGLPETFFGDASVGSLATAHSLDRPTELKFRDRQMLHGDVFDGLLQFAIDWATRAPSGPLPAGLKEDQRHIDISFPAILEDDIAERVKAIVSVATLDGKTDAKLLDVKTQRRLLLTALGEDDIDELLEQLEDMDAELADELAANKAAMPPAMRQPPPQDGQQPQDGPPVQESFTEAVRELLGTVRALRESQPA